MENLTTQQLQNQLSAINATRFLMEYDYEGSEQTVKELTETAKRIDREIAARTSAIFIPRHMSFDEYKQIKY